MRVKTLIVAVFFFSLGLGTGYIFSHYSFDLKIMKNLKFSEVENGRQVSGDAQFCNDNIPRYQQMGCVEKNSKQEAVVKESPSFKGKPCDPSIPKYSQIGCKEN